jgi:hypothetical protein
MKEKLLVQSLDFKEVMQLPDAWKPQDYLELLSMMEYDNLSAIHTDEIEEMCQLALTDLAPEEAAEIVLLYLLGNKLSENQIKSLAHEMLEDKMWEEYPDIHLHSKIFCASELLYRAYNGKFPKPEIVKISFTMIPTKEIKKSITAQDLVRILEYGVKEDTVIGRLFHEELNHGSFDDAKGIVWQFTSQSQGDKSLAVVMYSSLYWYNEFRYDIDFDATMTVGAEVPN